MRTWHDPSNEIMSEEDECVDLVNPWEVKAESAAGVDYQKIIGLYSG